MLDNLLLPARQIRLAGRGATFGMRSSRNDFLYCDTFVRPDKSNLILVHLFLELFGCKYAAGASVLSTLVVSWK